VFEIILPPVRPLKPFPAWLRLIWIVAAPLGLSLSARILWEKTLLTAEKGEQMIGFSLIHIHPGFFFSGLLCSIALLACLLPATVYLALARLKVSLPDYAMVAGSLFVFATMMLPDNFGLRFR